MKKLQIRYFLFIILFLPIILLGCNQESSKEIAPHEADPETDEEKQFYESIDMTRERTGQILKIANVSRITTLDPQVTEDWSSKDASRLVFEPLLPGMKIGKLSRCSPSVTKSVMMVK